MKECYPYIEEYNPAQKAVIESGYLDNDENYIISIPTASGKTVLGVLAALKVLLKGGKVVYAVPLISLQNEKYKEFKVFEKFGFKVGKHPSRADIAVMVFESFDALTRFSRNVLNEIDLLILDEFHMIGDYSRGPTIECAITRIKEHNPGIRIIALSATLQNMDEMAHWLEAEVVTHDYRPVPLHKEVLCAEEFGTKDKNNMVFKILNDSLNESSQMLTFVSTRRFTESLAQNMSKKISKYIPDGKREIFNNIAEDILDVPRRNNTQPTEVCYKLADCVKNGIAFHHAGLFDKQKEIIEEEFVNGNLLMITATPSLMYGVNLPSKNVVIRDYTRWTDQGQTNIPVFDYEQMSGRAGRPGFDTEGYSYLLAKTYDEAFNLDEYYVHGEIEVTNSKLIDNEDAVLKQIITQVSSGFAKDMDELVDFFNKTFYGFQISHTYNTMSLGFSDESIKYEISSALEYLVQNGIIRITPSGLQTTPLGTLISRNNYEVKTAVKLKDYSTMMGDNFNPGSLIYEISKTHDMPKINTKFRANKDNIKEVLSKNGVFISFVSNNESTAASLLEWINERKEYEIENYLKVYAASTRRASYEASNLVKYFYDICDVLGNYKFLNEIDKLASRLYYGVKEELIPLVVGIKRLGRQRARTLVDTYGDNLGNAHIKDLTRIDGIGEKTAENIIKFYENKE
ncbi:DEAD/DEAH box helicase [Methanosphaera sp. Vir-13MRS]|uniref:DEAD/DEAH box helicase n=1 Tax=Candidatus Methanosphaera massiliense TaxID=3017187 RepID=UPI0023801E5A|nr:DEAD/DEAH box helicase [Candidatus Methanosphaera massiliense]MDE4078058.1 DEAD/DEAH box helicase [Candidatus Methanosphaera massiliense]